MKKRRKGKRRPEAEVETDGADVPKHKKYRKDKRTLVLSFSLTISWSGARALPLEFFVSSPVML